MLSSAEEIQLVGIANSLENNWHDVSLVDIQFLVDKLKETNDELSQVHLELQKTNEQLAAMYESRGL